MAGQWRAGFDRGALAVVALCVASAAALLVWLGVPETAEGWVTVVSGALAPPALWVSIRQPPTARPEPDSDQALADLGTEMRDRWLAELARRSINDPYSLPVRWESAPAALVHDWSVLVRLASSDGAGWPQPPPATRWATGPGGLAGTGSALVEVLDRVPTGRLLVLGDAGAGKSVLLLRLMLDLLAARRPGAPVPFLVHLASWDPTEKSLPDFLADRLVIEHPRLGARLDEPAGPPLAQALFDGGLIIPLLDGLDELPGDARRLAVERINDGIRPGMRLVVTSRRADFEDVVGPAVGAGMRLSGAAGIQLCPLDTAQAAAYLRATAAGQLAEQRWEPVLAALSPPAGHPIDAPLVRVFATPLAVALARTIYNPRPGEATGVVPDPAELLDRTRFPDGRTLWQHLFDGFVPAAYRPRPGSGPAERWQPADAVRWLGFLAGHLEHNRRGDPDLLWWALPAAVPPKRRLRLALRLPILVWFGQLVVAYGPDLAVAAARCVRHRSLRPVSALNAADVRNAVSVSVLLLLVSCLSFYWLFDGLHGIRGWGTRTPSRRLRWRPSHRCGLVAGGAGLLAALLSASYLLGAFSERTFDGSAAWTVLGGTVLAALGTAAAVLVAGGLRGVEGEAAGDADGGLAADRQVFWRIAAGTGPAVWVGGLLLLGASLADQAHPPRFPTVGWVAAGLAAFVVVPPVALAVAAARTAWGTFALTRRHLARRGELPRDLVGFLTDAHDRGVLRRAGGAYQFRHVELQRRLAGSSPDPAADQLAAEVGTVCAAGLRDRSPADGLLELAWQPASGELQPAWEVLSRSRPLGGRDWPVSGAGAFAGAGSRLVSTFDQTPTGRLVVLGAAGSGRGVLLLRLVLDLLARRDSGAPVPFLTSLSSWDPLRQSLSGWLATRIGQEHPWLGRTTAGISRARALVDAGQILPVLDDLDRLPPAARAAVIPAVNELVRSGGPVVLASRPDGYALAVGAGPGPARFLDGAAVIEVVPLGPAALARRLELWDRREPGRWAPVAAALRAAPHSPVAAALSAPLAVWLADVGYGPRPGADADPDLPAPVELCDTGRLADRVAVTNLLVDRFLAAVYPEPEAGSGHRPAARATATLTFLARHLDQLGTTRIEWWMIARAMPPRVWLALNAVVGGVSFGVLGAAHSPVTGVAYGCAGAVISGVALSSGPFHRGIAISPAARRRRATSPDAELTPATTLAVNRAYTLRVGLPVGALLMATLLGLLPQVGGGPWWGPTRGVLVGALFGALVGFAAAPWGAFVIARCWLRAVHRLPFDLPGFLADAHRRGVLTQTAAAWEFRFSALPHRLIAADSAD